MPLILAADSGGGGSALTPIILLVLLAAFAYFMLIRPQRARQRQAQQLQQQLRVGTEVMTTAGLYGTVAAIDDDVVTLEVAPGVHNRYLRAAIARVVTPQDAPFEAEDEVESVEEAPDPDKPRET